MSKESNSNSPNLASFAFSLISNKPGAILKAINYIDLEINNKNNVKNFVELKNKLKPLCNNFVDFGNYFSENVELD